MVTEYQFINSVKVTRKINNSVFKQLFLHFQIFPYIIPYYPINHYNYIIPLSQ